jgi:hypothetical protein
MRRISLALALVGAMAATGCGTGTSPAGSAGQAPGVAEGNFKVTVQNGQAGAALKIKDGYVTSSPAGINCGVSATGTDLNACEASFPVGQTVTLTATAVNGKTFLQWAGDCEGTEVCAFTSGADKYLIASFGSYTEQGVHPNWSDAAVHAAEYRAASLQCNTCHGSNWKGLAIAPSCYTCHNLESFPVTKAPAAPMGGHFDSASHAWEDHGGWSSSCTRCHTSGGYQDYVGVDGSADYLGNADGTWKTTPTNTLTADTQACRDAGTCNPAAFKYGALTCVTCHNARTDPNVPGTGIATIVFPSDKKVTTDKSTALCGQCHGARNSTKQINAKIASTGPDAALSGTFTNPHYAGAAATLFGADAQGWAEYPGMVYTKANKHGGLASCTDCHDPHTGALPADGAEITAKCGACHFDELSGAPVATYLQLEESRQFGFEGDIDGDGVQEPLKEEIEALTELVYAAMKVYATNVVGTSIVYDGESNPYFFVDANGDGVKDATETTSYASFTPRLLRAAFNYKWSHAEAGAWAHNPRYAIEVLYDALFDLNAGIRADATAPGTPVPTANVRGSFTGHFGSSGFLVEPYAQFLYHPAAGSFFGTRGPGFSGNTCYQCHGGKGGFDAYLPLAGQQASASTALTLANKVTGMQCATCHVDGADMKGIRADVPALFVPPQKAATVPANGVVSFANAQLPASFALCGTCHSGLENKASVDAKIGSTAADSFSLGFVNPHYFGAAGVILGSDAKVLYEYPSKSYQGKAVIWSVGMAAGPHGSPHGARCTGCHDPVGSKHSFEIDTATTVVKGDYHGVPNTQACDGCHVAGPYGDYRLAPKKENLQRLGAKLLVEIKAYATTAGFPICYFADAYPYFLLDNGLGGGTAGDGTCQTGELVRTNAYNKFNPALLRAAYNYQWFVKEPGAAEHNYEYVAQALIDSILDLNPAAVLPEDAFKTDGSLIVRPAAE